MTQNDSELLKNYVQMRSEEAFAELVRRHIGLVYSAALRKMNGVSHLAEDITQIVFSSLAKKAPELTRHTSIAGWLHTSVRYAASDSRRSEQRRSTREQDSFLMNELLNPDGSSPDWEQLRPIIDDTLNELEAEDREAILLRYFQGCVLAEVGARLGIQENTARMRVDRALEKLRVSLARRKITSTAAVLANSLTGYAMSTASAGLATQVSQLATAVTAAVAGSGTVSLLGSKVAKFLIAAAVVTAVVLPVAHHLLAVRAANSQAHLPANPDPNNAGLTALSSSQNPGTQSNQTVDTVPLLEPRLDIYLDDPRTGKPVPGITIDEHLWCKADFKTGQFYSDKNGWCEVTYPSNVTDLELTTRLEGYADTRLEWHPDHGDFIPQSYTLHLAQPVTIGGVVVDANGAPVAGAKVGLGHEDAPLLDTLPESHQFGWIQVVTDADGRWQINRIAEDMIRRLRVRASAPDYVGAEMVFVGREPETEKASRTGTCVFKLGNAVTISGSVVDAIGNPLPGAKVFVGYDLMSDKREAVADTNGNFIVSGCNPGDNLLTASAPGLANTTEEINTTNSSSPYQIVLTKGGTLDILVQNSDGVPIPQATAWLDCMNQEPVNSPHYTENLVQVDFQRQSDLAGRIIWTNAPTGELKFEFSVPGYMRSEGFYFKADGQEHSVILHPPLTISGTVRDADSGEPIPHFRVGIGWPEKDYQTGQTNGHWSSIARFWPEFSDGQFSNTMEEAALRGIPNPGYVLKFEADGYQSFVSRAISPDEGQAHFDVALHRAVSLAISVTNPDGQPAAGADVGLVSSGGHLTLLPGGFSQNDSGANLLRTDVAGHFSLTSDDAITRVIVASPAGYAETSLADLQTNPAIILQAWGRIEGTCLSGGQPVAGREYTLDLFDNNADSVRADFMAFHVVSDGQGKFVMPMAPPGKHYLVRQLRSQVNPGGMGWTGGDKTEVNVLPGQTTPVTFGNNGYTVTVTIQWPDGAPPTKIQQMMVSLHTLQPTLPPQTVGHPDLIRQYRQSPEFQAIARTLHRYAMTANAGGMFEADDVSAGNYQLSAFVILQPQPGQQSELMSNPGISVTIPSDPPIGQLDAGTIEMQPTAQQAKRM